MKMRRPHTANWKAMRQTMNNVPTLGELADVLYRVQQNIGYIQRDTRPIVYVIANSWRDVAIYNDDRHLFTATPAYLDKTIFGQPLEFDPAVPENMVEMRYQGRVVSRFVIE